MVLPPDVGGSEVNSVEVKMLDMLKRGRDEHGVVAVKAEFEAEGTRMDELLRLVEIAHAAGLSLAVKIGGCEAIRDLLESKQIGVRYIIAPMVETPYALSKYIAAKKKIFTPDEAEDTDFLFNLETITGFDSRTDLVKLAAASNSLNGIVFGRVDFCGSMGLDRDSINRDLVTEHVVEVGELCQGNGLDLVVGGGVSMDSIPALKRMRETHLSRFETRKVVFNCPGALQNSEEAFLKAVEFEIAWLKNKKDHYGNIHREDDARLVMMEDRYQKSIEAIYKK